MIDDPLIATYHPHLASDHLRDRHTQASTRRNLHTNCLREIEIRIRRRVKDV
jgi:hypothetical protein